MNWKTVEEQSLAEWNWFYASVALHPHAWLIVAFILGVALGHIL